MKPTYLWTSQKFSSATNMRKLGAIELNNLKRSDSHTNRAIPDRLPKTLPNGWYFSFSNEVYKDNNDKYYENIGVPVNYKLNYSNERQTLFRSIANNLEKVKKNILNAF